MRATGYASNGSSSGLRNNEFFGIHIKHLPTKQTVSFEGWVTQFSDTYTAQWNEQRVYGRMDPLATYEGTGRQILLSFDIPNDSKMAATANMQKIQQFIKFMYPVYNDGEESVQNVLTAAPLLTLKWTNLISSPNNEGQELVGYINGPISYAPDVAEGGFMSGEITTYETEGTPPKDIAIRNYFPKKISMSFGFTVLHTHLVGWTPTDNTKTSFIFGNEEINDRFPNIYKEFPIPNDVLAGRPGEEVSDAEAQAAIDADVAALETSRSEGEIPSPTQQEIAQQNQEEYQRNMQDAAASLREISQPGGGEMSTDYMADNAEFLRNLGITP